MLPRTMPLCAKDAAVSPKIAGVVGRGARPISARNLLRGNFGRSRTGSESQFVPATGTRAVAPPARDCDRAGTPAEDLGEVIFQDWPAPASIPLPAGD